MIKTIFKLLYALILVGIGASISIYFVSLANSKHDNTESKFVKESFFPNYIDNTQNNYSSFKNMESHFHTYTPQKMSEIESQTICLNCHSPFPHEKDIKVRAFNNQHYKYLTCESCHTNGNDFEWFDFEIDNSITRIDNYGLEINKNNSNNINYISKISQKNINNNFIKYNDPSIQKLKTSIKSKNDDNYNKLRAVAEKNLTTAKTCNDCHNKNSEFPWVKLGFSPDKINQMKNNSIVNMITKYDTFHFPPIFEK